MEGKWFKKLNILPGDDKIMTKFFILQAVEILL